VIDFLIALFLALGENIGICYLPPMVKCRNFEFIFIIKDPKRLKKGEEIHN